MLNHIIYHVVKEHSHNHHTYETVFSLIDNFTTMIDNPTTMIDNYKRSIDDGSLFSIRTWYINKRYIS